MTNFRQVPLEHVIAGLSGSELRRKRISERLLLRALKLREAAAKLMEHATILIARAVELEKQVSRLKRDKPTKKP
jgi:hypothetical protein